MGRSAWNQLSFSQEFYQSVSMPGHIKKCTGPDPDPSPWLCVSAELKNKLKALAKMESRIRELELELGSVQAHTSENQKGFMRSERKSKELAFQLDEDKKNQERMTQLASALQAKIKTYK